ncbi:MAG: hypothetical protein K9K39_01975 [Desulfohalobiaceae bacterium]|nr:hypothetical protein [Desulfohalobiaceae bacterium]
MEATTLALSGYLGILIFVGSLVPGAAVTACLAEAICGLGGKKFWDKFGQQQSAMGAKALILFLILIVPGIFWGSIQAGYSLGWDFYPGCRVFGVVLFPLLGGLLGMAVYSASWVSLGHNKPLRRFLGAVSLLGLLGGLYGCLNIFLAWTLFAWPQTAPLWGGAWVPATWAVWPAWAGVVLNGIGAAGAAGMGYLLLRREKDDFGRDYYRFALRGAAKWAMVLPLPAALGIGWAVLHPQDLSGYVLIAMAVAAFAALALVWLSSRVLRNPHPLRLKGSVITVCILTWILDSALGLYLFCGLLSA